MDNSTFKGLYAISNNADPISHVQAVLNTGIAMLQYREKSKPDPAFARQLCELCIQYSVPLIVNDDLELAKSIEAHGVHLGEDDHALPEARDQLGQTSIIGVSCYDSIDLALDAEKCGASYVAFGSFYPTTSKKVTRHATTELLLKAREQLSIPIVAIGGITPENGGVLVDAGADMLAAIQGVFGAPDPAAAAKAYTALFK